MVGTEPPEASDVNLQMEVAKKSARRAARCFTVVYLLLFPFLFGMAWFSPMIFSCSYMPVSMGLSVIFLTSLLPFSIPVSIYLIWSRFFKGNYKKMYLFCFLPILTFIGVFILTDVLRSLLSYLAPH